MVKKPKTEPTEWALGQPLVFPDKHNPTDVNLPPREVETAIGKPLAVPKSGRTGVTSRRLIARACRQFNLILSVQKA